MPPHAISIPKSKLSSTSPLEALHIRQPEKANVSSLVLSRVRTTLITAGVGVNVKGDVLYYPKVLCVCLSHFIPAAADLKRRVVLNPAKTASSDLNRRITSGH